MEAFIYRELHHVIWGLCHAYPRFIAPIGIYADRVARRHPNHLGADGTAAASRAESAGIGAEDELCQ